MSKVIAEYKFNVNGPSFFIPENEDFLKDVMPANCQEDEDGAFENRNDDAERFNDYMRNGEESLLRE